MMVSSICGDSVRECCFPKNISSPACISKIVFSVLAILAIIGSIVAYVRAAPMLGHSLMGTGGGALLCVVLIAIIERVKKCWNHPVENEEQPAGANASPVSEPIPTHSDGRELYRERRVILPMPVDLSSYTQATLFPSFHPVELERLILDLMDPTSLCILAGTCKSFYAYIHHQDSALRLKIDMTFKHFPFMRCLEMADDQSTPALPIIKSFFSGGASTQIPFVEFKQIAMRFDALDELFPLSHPYCIGQDSDQRWMFLIKFTAVAQSNNNSLNGIIAFCQISPGGSAWDTGVSGQLGGELAKDPELIKALLEKRTYIRHRNGRPISYSVWKPRSLNQ